MTTVLEPGRPVAWVLPSLIGSAVGGGVAEHAGWRWVFLGLIPLVVAPTVPLIPALRGIRTAAIGAIGAIAALRLEVRT